MGKSKEDLTPFQADDVLTLTGLAANTVSAGNIGVTMDREGTIITARTLGVLQSDVGQDASKLIWGLAPQGFDGPKIKEYLVAFPNGPQDQVPGEHARRYIRVMGLVQALGATCANGEHCTIDSGWIKALFPFEDDTSAVYSVWAYNFTNSALTGSAVALDTHNMGQIRWS